MISFLHFSFLHMYMKIFIFIFSKIYRVGQMTSLPIPKFVRARIYYRITNYAQIHLNWPNLYVQVNMKRIYDKN